MTSMIIMRPLTLVDTLIIYLNTNYWYWLFTQINLRQALKDNQLQKQSSCLLLSNKTQISALLGTIVVFSSKKTH